MFKKLMKLLNYENILNIKISKEFKNHPPKYTKLMEKQIFYLENNKFKDDIILDNTNTLVDGYTAYLIAKQFHKKWLKVKYI